MNKKRITAPFYTVTKLGIRNMRKDTRQPDGSLYARGRYATKIKSEDLPEHYIEGTIFKVNGYISVLGIKDIVYKPNYHINHMHRDDCLYISYDRPIRSETDARGYVSYVGSVEFSEQHRIFHGKVQGIHASISYEGTSINELTKDFHEAIDSYLALCESEGIEPETPSLPD